MSCRCNALLYSYCIYTTHRESTVFSNIKVIEASRSSAGKLFTCLSVKHVGLPLPAQLGVRRLGIVMS